MSELSIKKNKSVARVITHNLVLIVIVLLIVVTAIVEPKFASASNLTNVLRLSSSAALSTFPWWASSPCAAWSPFR